MKKMNGILALALCAFMWSSGGVLIKLVEWNSFSIAGTRSLIGFIVMCVLKKKMPRFTVLSKDSQGTLRICKRATFNMWMGGICYCLTMITFVIANKMTTAANAILLQYTSPIYLIILGPILLKEKNDKSDYFCVLGVMIGMVLFLADGLEVGNMAGNIIALFSGFVFAGTTLFMRNGSEDESFYGFLIAHLLTFVISIPFTVIDFAQNGFVSVSSVLGLLALGVFQIGIPSILFSVGVVKVRALTANFITMIEPLMNPVWVLLFVGEKPSLFAVLGGILILGCISIRAVIQQRKSNFEK